MPDIKVIDIKLKANGKKYLMIAAIVIVIAVVMAGASFLIDNEKTKTSAPGSMVSYSLNGSIESSGITLTISGTMENVLSAQNDTEYFTKSTVNIDWIYNGSTVDSTTQESIISKEKDSGVPSDAEMIGTAQINTIDGKKTVNVWKYDVVEENMNYTETDYISEDNGITYKIVLNMESNGMSIIANLTNYDLKWQNSYRESSAIGLKYNYDAHGNLIDYADSEINGTAVAECVGEGLGKYCFKESVDATITYGGQSTPLSKTGYYIEESTSGLETGAVKTGTIEMQTIDGVLTLDIWNLSDENGTTIDYVSQDGDTIYMTTITTDEMYMELTLTSKS